MREDFAGGLLVGIYFGGVMVILATVIEAMLAH